MCNKTIWIAKSPFRVIAAPHKRTSQIEPGCEFFIYLSFFSSFKKKIAMETHGGSKWRLSVHKLSIRGCVILLKKNLQNQSMCAFVTFKYTANGLQKVKVESDMAQT